MRKLPVILGPTGVGKTKIAVEVAERIGAEIIGCDSRQVYQGMDIGTGKPTLVGTRHGVSLHKKVPHWLIDVVSPDVTLNAWEYAKLARRKINEIWKNPDKIGIVVGGSGLYLRALIDGFFRISSPHSSIREKLELVGTRHGVSLLYERLKEIDPDTALRLHFNDRVRIIRALEVYEITRTPISVLKKQRVRFNCNPIYIGLTMRRALLYQRIEERVDRMMENGFLKEVRGLLKNYPLVGAYNWAPLQTTIGYKELADYWSGKTSLSEAVRLIKRNTRRYAKRQFTWFKSIKDVHWIELPDSNVVEKCIKLIER